MALRFIEQDIDANDVPHDWATRKRDAIDRLDQLRRDRGVARLDGTSFDDRSIIEAESEIDALGAAEVEAERRQRAERDAAIERRRGELRAQMVDSLDRRSKAIIEAEAALFKLASALEVLLSTSKETSLTIQNLGHSAPFSLNATDVRLRASIRMAAILGPVCGPEFGKIRLPAIRGPILPDGTSMLDSWHDSDALKIAADISQIISPEPNL
jgi:hypothetical protein